MLQNKKVGQLPVLVVSLFPSTGMVPVLLTRNRLTGICTGTILPVHVHVDKTFLPPLGDDTDTVCLTTHVTHLTTHVTGYLSTLFFIGHLGKDTSNI